MFSWAKSIIRENCGNDDGYWYLKEDFYQGYLSKKWKINGSVTSELMLPHYEKPTTLVKTGNAVTAALVGGADDGFFLKRYNYRSWQHSLKRMFQYPRAYRCLAMSLLMKKIGLETPEVLGAVCYYRGGWFPGRSFLITRQLPEDAGMLDYLAFETGTLDNFQVFAEGMTDMLARMHREGIVHGDLSLRNLFCYFKEDGAPDKFGVIDLDGSNYYCGVKDWQRACEVARIASSYCRCVRKCPDKASLPDVVDLFIKLYAEKSGIKLDSEQVFARANYLLERRRRN